MKLDRVDIHTTDQKVKISSTQPKLELTSTKPKVNIEQPAATLEISTEAAKLLIDQSKAWRDMGLFTPKESVENAAAKGKQDVLAGIAKTVQQGNMMMDSVSQGGNVMKQIGLNSLDIKPINVGIDWIPSVGAVKSTYVPGKLDINITPHAPRYDVQLGKLTGHYTPGKVYGDTIQRASVTTTVIKGE